MVFATPSDAQAAIEVRWWGGGSGGRSVQRVRCSLRRGGGAVHTLASAVYARTALPVTPGCFKIPVPAPTLTPDQLLNGTEMEGRPISAKLDRYSS